MTKKLSQFCDVLISSNTSKYFNKQKNIIKVLWLHNQMQIEKSIRKKQLLSILLNKPNCVFVSKYLKNILFCSSFCSSFYSSFCSYFVTTFAKVEKKLKCFFKVK